MARSDWILPRADSACGKVFHPDRRSAEGHRIALEFWNQATGHTREGYRLVTYWCKRCGGFHAGTKRTESRPVAAPSSPLPDEIDQDWTGPSLALEMESRSG